MFLSAYLLGIKRKIIDSLIESTLWLALKQKANSITGNFLLISCISYTIFKVAPKQMPLGIVNDVWKKISDNSSN